MVHGLDCLCSISLVVYIWLYTLIVIFLLSCLYFVTIFSSLCLRLVDLLLALDYVEIIEVPTGGLYELSSLNVLTIDVAICSDPDK